MYYFLNNWRFLFVSHSKSITLTMLSGLSENLIPFYVCCRLTIVYLTFQDKINLHFTVTILISFCCDKILKEKKTVRHPVISTHFWNINKMKNLRSHKSIFHCRDSLSVILLDWTALWVKKIRAHSFFPLPTAYQWNRVQGEMGALPALWIFFCTSGCYQPKHASFPFFPTPLFDFYLPAICDFSELKLILILDANTTFQPFFLFFFASEFEFSISKTTQDFFSPSNAADSAGHFSSWKAKPFPVQVLLKMICFSLAL